MRYGDIKLEALRIMQLNQEEILTLNRMTELLSVEKYARYLNNMDNVIRKAIDIINNRKILPTKSIAMELLKCERGKLNNRFSLYYREEKKEEEKPAKPQEPVFGAIETDPSYDRPTYLPTFHAEEEKEEQIRYHKIEDFQSISSITYESDRQYYNQVPYFREADKIVIKSCFQPQYMMLLYNPKIILKRDIADKDEIDGLPDELALLIPYYIKFELYQEEEPELANLAKMQFENGLEQLVARDNEYNTFEIQDDFTY